MSIISANGSLLDRAQATRNSAQLDAIENSVGAADGIAPLDGNGMIAPAYIPVLNRSCFGMRFDGVNSVGTPLGDAVGMKFTPSVGAAAGIDTWADAGPFAVKDININLATGEVVAQKGDAGFALDGSNGDVYVDFPLGYYSQVIYSDYVQDVWIADRPGGGFLPSPAHNRAGVLHGHVDAAKYKAYWDGSKLRSISGVYPTGNMTRGTARTRAAALGSGFYQYDAAFHSWLEMLMAVKYGNLNVQTAIGNGLYSLPYDASPVATMAETDVNRIVLATAQAARFAVGLYIAIGSSAGSTSVANARRITAITVVDASNTALEFDGAAISTAVGNVAWCCGNNTGDCDAVPGICGRAEYLIGSNGQVRCFGLESPYAERWTWEDGHNINDNQSYICTDPAQFVDDVFEAPYSQLSYANAAANGYILRRGYDPAHPFMLVCSAVGGDSAKPVGDYYAQNTGARVSRVGGYLSDGSFCGPSHRRLVSSSASAGWDFVARTLRNRA